jgi:hypothetical protein
MERYCKAYPAERLQEFPGWGRKNSSAERSTPAKDGEEPAKYLYLHQDYTVTDGIFSGENVVYEDLTPEWIEFCKNVLKFEVPVYESIPSEEKASASAASQ